MALDFRLVLPILLLAAHQISQALAQICYTPDGSVSNDRPCSIGGSDSVCCTQGFLCTSNLLCQPAHWHSGQGGNPLQFIRGTCTDKTWKSPECQGHCVKENPSGGEWVMRCGDNSTRYCCSAEDCCIKEDFLKVDLGVPTITATAGIISSTLDTTTATSSSLTTSSESQVNTQTTVPSVLGDSSSGPSPSKSNSLPIGVGIGIAVGVVTILGAVVLWWFFSTRKKREPLTLHEGRGHNHMESEEPGSNASRKGFTKIVTPNTTIYEMPLQPIELPDSTRVELP